jgi:hypothetical protein
VNPVHLGIICAACGVTPIRGCRFQCTVCPSFDLCDICEPKGEHTHPFLKIRKPDIKTLGRNRNRAGKLHRQRSFEGQPPGFERQRSVDQPPSAPGFVRQRSADQPPSAPGFVRQRSFGQNQPAGAPAAFGPIFRMLGRGLRPRIGPSSAFVSDVTLADGSDVPTNTDVVKTWKLRNDGLQPWPQGTALVLRRCKGEFETTPHPLSRLPLPGEEVEVSATIKTPRVGRGTVCFRLVDNNSVPFGAKMWADVIGVESKKEAPAKAEESAVAESAREVSLRALANMGFTDVDLNISLLSQENGHLQRVISRLLGMSN